MAIDTPDSPAHNATSGPQSPGTSAQPQAVTDESLEALYPDDQLAAENKEEGAGKESVEQPNDGTEQPYKLTVPDGIELDPQLLGAATPVFRDIGLTDAQASKLVPLVGQVQERMLEQQSDEFYALRADWAKQARADRQIGGAKWKDTMRLAGIALEAGGAPKGSEFRKLMDQSGLGNHPAVIKVFRRLGERLGAARQARGGYLSREEILYPND